MGNGFLRCGRRIESESMCSNVGRNVAAGDTCGARVDTRRTALTQNSVTVEATTATTMKIEDLDTVFADVDPLPQDDGPNPVCVIAYNQDFIKAYDYMRAILQSDEHSSA